MDPFLGSILMVGFNFAPFGWALCNGQLLPISQNTALFSLLGTQFGGNGTSTFALPDFRGRVPISAGTPNFGTFIIGEQAGTENVSLTSQQIPLHTHSIACNNTAAPTTNLTNPGGAVPGVIRTGEFGIYTSAAANATMAPGMIAPGSGTALSIIQPTLCMNFIIALQGVYPSRN